MCLYTVYRKTSDRSPVQIVLTPSQYPGPGIYAGSIFYQIIWKSLLIEADVLAYATYCIKLTLPRIAASEKYLMHVTYI